MIVTRRTLATLLAGLALVLAGAHEAAADRLDDAKAAGWVGERVDGYLGIVDADAPADVKRLVRDINAERRARYESIAERNDTTLEAVERLAGKKLIERAAPGAYVMDSTGRWKRK